MKDLEERPLHDTVVSDAQTALTRRTLSRWSVGLLLCGLGLVLCTLLEMTPLSRIPDLVITLQFAPGTWLASGSAWLPTIIGTKTQTAHGEFFGLLTLSFLCYGLAALCVQRQPTSSAFSALQRGLLLCTLLAGAIYVVTPAMLSHDILVYAGYGRVLATYQANPYFTPPSAFPGDPFTPLNYWANTVSAYGPIWTLVCGLFGLVLAPVPEIYVLAFRVLALAAHLFNAWLVGRILLTMGRSPRTATLGMLVYAWNPLVLLESALGGHNDIFMLTFVLLGIWLAVRAERDGTFLHARGYLPPLALLMLAVLVKFTSLPIVAAYLLWLACKILRSAVKEMASLRQALHEHWRPTLLRLCLCALVAGGIALAFYGPFWLGHAFNEILDSFKSPPSAIGAQNSFLRSLIEWRALAPQERQSDLLIFFSSRSFWDDLNYVLLAVCLGIGAVRLWRRPTSRTFLLIALVTWSAVLLLTPWFYSWYVTWIMGLLAVCLPLRRTRWQAALLVLVLTLSFSALITYPFHGELFGSYYFLVSICTLLPPVGAFLLTLLLWHPEKLSDTEEAAV